MNPHNHTVALDPPDLTGTGKLRRWQCQMCGEIGLLDDLMGRDQKKPCAYIYPPCESCGQTPTCAPDCRGILAALSSPNVRVIQPTAPQTCSTCKQEKECRPFGKDGASICFQCAMATPESQAETEKQLTHRMGGKVG